MKLELCAPTERYRKRGPHFVDGHRNSWIDLGQLGMISTKKAFMAGLSSQFLSITHWDQYQIPWVPVPLFHCDLRPVELTTLPIGQTELWECRYPLGSDPSSKPRTWSISWDAQLMLPGFPSWSENGPLIDHLHIQKWWFSYFKLSEGDHSGIQTETGGPSLCVIWPAGRPTPGAWILAKA